MKKILTVLLLLISAICVSFAFSGCFTTPIQLFTEGTYETIECEDELYLKARLIIKPITEEQFENADSKNVIKNNSKDKENNIYYSFELFLYDDIRGDYVQAEISNLQHEDGTHPNDYIGRIKYNSENGDVSSVFILHYHSENRIVITYTEADSSLDLLFEIVS